MRNLCLWAAAAMLLSAVQVSYAQKSTELRWEPEISYSWKSSDRWGHNASLGIFNALDASESSNFVQYMEAQLSAGYGLSVRTKLGGGYLYRWSLPFQGGYTGEHRFIQQVGFISYFGDRRMAHRLRTEQRIRTSGYINRVRYRLSYDMPLEGERVDPGEKYLILSNEAMTLFNSNDFEGENRAHVGLGWYLNQRQKFEVGLEYRAQDLFTDSDVGHLMLFTSSFYLNR